MDPGSRREGVERFHPLFRTRLEGVLWWIRVVVGRGWNGSTPFSDALGKRVFMDPGRRRQGVEPFHPHPLGARDAACLGLALQCSKTFVSLDARRFDAASRLGHPVLAVVRRPGAGHKARGAWIYGPSAVEAKPARSAAWFVLIWSA